MESVRRAYGVRARQYIELFGSTEQVRADDLALIVRTLSMWPGPVLDVGCGPGHLTEHLRLLDVDSMGIDLVAEFVAHARSVYPDGRYEIGSMDGLPVPDCSVAGVLAWYSLIHFAPDALDGVLAELRRVMAEGATLVVGFFCGERLETFEHKVVSAYFWPVDEFSARLRSAGFIETERHVRSGSAEAGRRPHAAIVAVAL